MISLVPNQIDRSFGNKTIFHHGDKKSGKTKFWEGDPTAVFLASEPRHDHISSVVVPVQDWETLIKLVRSIVTGQEWTTRRTVIMDTIDDFVRMQDAIIRADYGVKHIGDVPFNKGYGLLNNKIYTVCKTLAQSEYVRLVMIAHSTEKDDDSDPDGKKRKKMVPAFGGALREMLLGLASCIFYQEIAADGSRILHPNPGPRWVAASSLGSGEKLPDNFVLQHGDKRDYESFVKLYEDARIAPMSSVPQK